MRLFSRRRDAPERRALTRAAGLTSLTTTPAGAITPANATTIADVYACVRVLADAAASVPLVAYRRTEAGRERYSGRIANLLREPAPGFTQADLIGETVAHLNLYGNAYIGKYRDGEGRIEALRLLAPDRMTVEMRGGELRYTWLDAQGHKLDLTRSDVVHVRGLVTDGLVGLSPVKQCSRALGLSQSLTKHAAQFFTDGALPGAIVTIPGNPTLEQRREFADSWESRQGGNRRLALLWAGAEYVPLTAPMDDLQFVEQRRLSAAEVARIFRVPPWMIGASDGDSLTYSNTEQQQLAFVMHSLRPWLVTLEQALSIDPDLSPASIYVEFLIDALLRADSKTRAEVYALALDPDRGWMRRAEVRRLENLDPETTV